MPTSPSINNAVSLLNDFLLKNPTATRHLMQTSAVAYGQSGRYKSAFELLRDVLEAATGHKLLIDQDTSNNITGFRVEAQATKEVWAIPVIAYIGRNEGICELDTAEDNALRLLRISGLEVVLAEDFRGKLVDDNGNGLGHPPREITLACEPV